MNKLTYKEKTDFDDDCPNLVKRYNTKAALVRDYLRFKENWTKIAKKDPYNNRVDENSGEGFKVIWLTTIVRGDKPNTQMNWIKSVKIEFEEE